MIPFKGQNTNLAFSSPQNLPKIIENFSIVPKVGSAVANVYLLSGIYQICIMPSNYNINANDMYLQQRQIVVLAGEQIKIQTSSLVDYDFNINDMPVETNNIIL